MKKLLLVLLFGILSINVFGQQVPKEELTQFLRINNKEDLAKAFELIKSKIATNSYYNVVLDNKNAVTPEQTILMVAKWPKTENWNHVVERLMFFGKGVKIDIYLSENEVTGLTSHYAQTERDMVFNRFYDLYRRNILGER